VYFQDPEVERWSRRRWSHEEGEVVKKIAAGRPRETSVLEKFPLSLGLDL